MLISPHISNLRFCKVKKESKVAVEKDWQKNTLTADQINPWIASGNNYGIVCSKDNGIGIIDADHEEYVLAVENNLPQTFSVQSSSTKKRHFYFRIANFPHNKTKIILKDPSNPDDSGKQGGDIRMGDFYVVGPGSIHPITKQKYEIVDNVPIADIDFDVICKLLSSYFKTSIVEHPKHKSAHGNELSIAMVLEKYDVKLSRVNNSDECFCAHPIHGSEGGSNFGVNLGKNVWICRRHNVGGSAFHLVAMMEKLIACEDINKEMPHNIFDATVAIIKDKFGIDMSVRWDKTSGGALRGTYNNVLNYLERHQPNIRLNLFSDTVEIEGREYRDYDTLQLKEKLRKIRLEPSVSIIDEAVYTYAQEHKHHPVRDYIRGLNWDGVNRCDDWLIGLAGANDCEYTRFVSRTLLVAAVKRVFQPGCQYDFMVILEGKQGIGKSRLVRTLGGPWYKEISLLERDKDTIQKMQGSWFAEVAELAVFAKRDIEGLRAFITNPIDHARFAYARHDNAYPRQSVFVGTINPEASGYFMDTTGNRRFLPIYINKVNIDKLEKVRDQLFAEAFLLYEKGINIHIDNQSLEDLATNEQSIREFHDDWQDDIINWFHRNRLDTGSCVTAYDVFIKVFNGRKEAYDSRVSRRISRILKKICGKDPEMKRINGIVGRFFDVSKLINETVTSEESNQVDDVTFL